jgi:hypothetical protein
MLKQFIVIALVIASVSAKCPNECSGKGTCGENDLCNCYAGYTGLDCSGRKCLAGKAWGDAPFADGYAHDYAECSGQGECDRKTGECKCNDGFTGDGCRYAACPNDCNGHGTCEFITELAEGTATASAGRTHIQYNEFVDLDRTLDGWDNKKARGCKCDPYYSGADCSTRMCPKGNDPLTKTTALSAQSRNYYTSVKDLGVAELEKPEVQSVFVTPPYRNANLYTAIGGHFSLTYTDMYGQEWTTRPIRVKSYVNLGVASTATGQIADATAAGYSVIRSGTGNLGVFKDHDNIEVNVAGTKTIVKVAQGGAGFGGLYVTPRISAVSATSTITLTLVNQDCGEIGVKRALMELPNQVIPSITVDETITNVLNMFRITFSDSSNSGDQNMLSCKADACDEDGCQPRKGALTAQYTVAAATGATTFAAATFTVTTPNANHGTLGTQPGDEVGYGSVNMLTGKSVAPDSGDVTKPLVVASVSGTAVVGTDRTIALPSTSTANAVIQIINRVTNRDKRAALSVTMATSNTAGGAITAGDGYTSGEGRLTCVTGTCGVFAINDLVRVSSIMAVGNNQPAMDGIAIVTVVNADYLELSRADGTSYAAQTDGDLGSTRTHMVITRLNTFPCSVEETRKGTSEALECSGRGTCDGSTGECACFDGYTNDDCSVQTVIF